MFGIGASELLVIFLVALLVLGPERLPQAARTLAKIFGEFRKASDDLRMGIVGITEENQDWRQNHNNPRIIEAQAEEQAKEEPKPELSVARNTEHKNG